VVARSGKWHMRHVRHGLCACGPQGRTFMALGMLCSTRITCSAMRSQSLRCRSREKSSPKPRSATASTCSWASAMSTWTGTETRTETQMETATVTARHRHQHWASWEQHRGGVARLFQVHLQGHRHGLLKQL
jgi:hypothetical protein